MSSALDQGRVKSCDHTAIPTILCIDDDPDISRTIELRLSNFDVNVKRTFGGMQGFAFAAHVKPDVIITDLRMPMGEGEFVVESLKRNSQTTHIPVIVLSGQPGGDLPKRLCRLGAAKFFRKPVRFDELLAELSRHITLRERYPEEDDASGELASESCSEQQSAGPVRKQ